MPRKVLLWEEYSEPDPEDSGISHPRRRQVPAIFHCWGALDDPTIVSVAIVEKQDGTVVTVAPNEIQFVEPVLGATERS